MELNRERLLAAYPAMPDVVRARMEDTLARLRSEQAALPRRAPARRLTFALALAIALLLCAIGVAAGLRMGVFDFMTELFGMQGVLPGAQELVQTPQAQLVLEHTTIALEEAVYDGGTLRVVYSVRAGDAPVTTAALDDPDSPFRQAVVADRASMDGCDWFYLNGQEHTMTGGSSVAHVVDEEAGQVLCYLDIQLASAGIVPEGDFEVRLPLAGALKERKTLDFPVRVADASAPLSTMEAGPVRVTVLSHSASPVRVYVHLRLERMPGAAAETYNAALGDWEDALLVDGAGNTLCVPEDIMTTALVEDERVEWSYTFPPTDAQEAYFVPTIIDENDQWVPDRTHAIRVQ